MKERGIIFTGESVQAILAGRKSQTRRVVKPQPSPKSDRAFVGMDNVWRFSHQTLSAPVSHASDDVRCPHGTSGTHLWVREALGVTGQGDCEYLADRREIHDERTHDLCEHYGDSYHFSDVKTVSPIFMPRWASRITLEVTDVRVERVQSISAADAWAEGVPYSPDVNPRHEFEELWDSINGKRAPWDSNPWVWCISFRRAGVTPSSESR